MFVRDAIPHSWNIGTNMVSKNTSEVIVNETGICWTKSFILVALLMANDITSGISNQLLTLAEDDSQSHKLMAILMMT